MKKIILFIKENSYDVIDVEEYSIHIEKQEDKIQYVVGEGKWVDITSKEIVEKTEAITATVIDTFRKTMFGG